MAKKSLKIVSYGILGLLVLVLLLAGMTQTQFFRDRLRSVALSKLDSLLDAQVYLGDLDGNLITGFSIDSISIKVGNTHLLHAARLALKYNPFELPGGIVSVGNLVLVRPTVNLVCGSDGVWNFQRMVRPTPEDTSKKSSDWTILLNRLELQDGCITLVDSNALSDSDHAKRDPYFVEYHDFSLKQLHLVLSGVFGRKEKQAHISSLSFVSDRPGVEVKNVAGKFLVSRDEALVKDLVIETGRSHLVLDASLKDADLFGGVELSHLKRSPVRVSLHAHDLDLNELKRFLPEIAFLNESVALDLEAGGDFGNVDVRKLDLRKGKTQVNLSGTVLNLHAPEKLSLVVKSTESKVYPPDALALLPTFNLPDLEKLGVTTLYLEFNGTPADFRTKFLLETDAGHVHVDAGLTIGGPKTMKYKGTFSGRNLDLARIFRHEDLASRLNCEGKIEGEGVSIHGLNATMALDIDSSEFRGQPVGKSRLTIEGGQDRLRGTMVLGIGQMRSAITAELDEQNSALPAFSLDANVSSLNLDDLVHNASLNSDLTMTVKAHGTGLTLDKLNGELSLDFSPSRYGVYKISSGTMHILIDQKDPQQKRLAIESNIADFSLTGAFDPEYLVQLLLYEVYNVRSSLREKFATFDTTSSPRVTGKDLESWKRQFAPRAALLDASFVLQLKDLEPISIVTGNRTFNGTGVLKGSMKGNYQNLSFGAKLTLDDFFYGNVEAGILIQDMVAAVDLKDLKPVDALKDLYAQMIMDAGKIHINRNEFDSVRTTVGYRGENATYVLHGIYNNATKVSLRGEAAVSGEQIHFLLGDLQVAYKDFAWQADTGASVDVNNTGIHLHDLSLRRDTQVVSINGMLGVGGTLDATFKADRINLSNTRYVLSKEELGPEDEAFAGVVAATLTAGGTLDAPQYKASIDAEEVSYRMVPFGHVRGDFTYIDQLLTCHVDVDDRIAGTSDKPELAINGTLPLNLALVAHADNKTGDVPMDLHFVSDGIQMGILDPLVPTFNELKGILRCDLRVTGSPKSPTYAGAISVDSCSFLFLPNNISYAFEGKFQPAADRIKVLNALIRSDPADELLEREGSMQLSGDFSLRDFHPTDFNLSATGNLLIVKETTRKSELSVYGNLFVEIGPAGLHFTGTIEHSKLKGDITVRNSSLIFPPTQVTVKEESPLAINLVQFDDTTRVAEAPRTATARYFGRERETNSRSPNESDNQQPSKSFLDGVEYDLDITAEGGETEFRMIFSQATNEELVAYIQGKFSITEDGTRWVGDLNIRKAYYNFFKRFDAEGKIVYTGDFQNPELDIKAQYQGTRTLQDSTSGDRKEKVIVYVKISGTRYEPKLDISMTIDGQDYSSYTRGPKSYDVKSDALQFIAYGSFPLSTSERNDISSSIGSSVGISLLSGATSLFTNELSDFLQRETGFIKSIEFQYGSQGSIGERAEIRVSGVAAGGIWRIGNNLNSIDNANVSLLYSIGEVFNAAQLRNFMVEYERRIETTVGQSNSGRPVNSARLFYRISF